MEDMISESIEVEGWNDGMDFEFCMRRLFGEKAYHIACCNTDPEERTKWTKKLLNQFIVDIQSIDIQEQQRDLIECKLKIIERQNFANKHAEWDLFFQLLDTITLLLGYSGLNGNRCFNLSHWETKESNFDRLNSMGKADELQQRCYNTGEKRTDLMEAMRMEGYSDFDISLVFNTSEYQVKKARKARARGRG